MNQERREEGRGWWSVRIKERRKRRKKDKDMNHVRREEGWRKRGRGMWVVEFKVKVGKEE